MEIVRFLVLALNLPETASTACVLMSVHAFPFLSSLDHQMGGVKSGSLTADWAKALVAARALAEEPFCREGDA